MTTTNHKTPPLCEPPPAPKPEPRSRITNVLHYMPGERLAGLPDKPPQPDGRKDQERSEAGDANEHRAKRPSGDRDV